MSNQDASERDLAPEDHSEKEGNSRRGMLALLGLGLLGSRALAGCAPTSRSSGGQGEDLETAEQAVFTATSIYYAENVTDLRTAAPSPGTVAVLLSYDGTAATGPARGVFVWDPTVSAPMDNGGTVFYGNSAAGGGWRRIYSGPLNVRWFGAKGDGTADDTVAIQLALKQLGVLGGGSLFFPEGTYLVTRIPDSPQPAAHAALTSAVVFVVPDKVKLVGLGPGASVISVTFPNHGASNSANSMVVFAVGNDFEAEGIRFSGNYAPSPFVFFPLNNGNAMIGARILLSQRHSIHDCEFRNIPGFSIGTIFVDTAECSGNEFRHCANGYNVSGQNILVTNNVFHYSEGIESAGNTLNGSRGGRIQVTNNAFYECNGAASLGGNFGTAETDDSYGYVFANNTICNDVVVPQSALTLANNARSSVVTGNTFKGKFRFAMSVLTAGQPAASSARDGLFAANYVEQSYPSAPSTEAAMYFEVQESGAVYSVIGNHFSTDSLGVGVLMASASGVTVHVAGNYCRARFLAGFIGGNASLLQIAPSNVFVPSDPSYLDIVSSGGTAATHAPSTIRAPLADATSADVPEFVARLKGLGTTESVGVYRRLYSGRQDWGPATAAGLYDTTLERTAVGTLSMGATNAFRTGRGVTAGRPAAATVGAGAQFYDTTLAKPIWSDGAVWRDAAGTAV